MEKDKNQYSAPLFHVALPEKNKRKKNGNIGLSVKKKTELKKTVIALGVKYAKKFKMDRIDSMDPMDFQRYQKNKIVYLVYLVHLVHKMPIPEFSSRKSI